MLVGGAFQLSLSPFCSLPPTTKCFMPRDFNHNAVLHVCQTIGFILVAYATHLLWHLDQGPTSMTTDGSFYKLPLKTTTLQTSASIAEFERKAKMTSSEDKQDLPATVDHKPATENVVVLETVIEEEYNEKTAQNGVIENRQAETI